MLNREERVRIILNECEKFSKVSNLDVGILTNVHDMLISEVSGDVQNIYRGVSKDEMKEDVKILLDHVTDIESQNYRELIMEVIIKLTRLMAA